jgi:arylsulfatase A-like enzyme
MSKGKKNCLLTVVDCLRADKCWSPEIRTPTIDYLTENGTSFTQAIASTSTTSPSFASILTGLYPPAHGIKSLSGFRLNNEVETLPEILKKDGYSTYAEVTGPLLPEVGLNRGFDRYHCRDPGDNVNSDWYKNLAKKFEEGDLEEPWFMLLHLFELHRGHKEMKIPKDDPRIKGNNRYEKTLSYMDLRFGDLLESLNLDQTLVVLCADHGQRIAESKFDELIQKVKTAHRLIKKKIGLDAPRTNPSIGHGFHVYDPLVRIPLIFMNKELFPEGRKVSSQVRQIDIFPTLVDTLGLEFEGEIHGKSVMSLLEDGEKEERLAYMEACGAVLEDKKYWRAGIRTNKYKYIWAPYNEAISEELYDLEKDPEEKENIADDMPGLTKNLRQWGERIRQG